MLHHTVIAKFKVSQTKYKMEDKDNIQTEV